MAQDGKGLVRFARDQRKVKPPRREVTEQAGGFVKGEADFGQRELLPEPRQGGIVLVAIPFNAYSGVRRLAQA